jgi:CheY-like chemotaxis protein
MPVMDGLVVTERIRGLKEKRGDVSVVAVTAFDTYGMREAARSFCNGKATVR